MEQKLRAIQNGKYILAETDKKNEFILYREDYKLLNNNLGNMPIEMCQDFFNNYYVNDQGNYAVHYVLSVDKKCIKVVVEKITNTKTYKIRYH